MKQGTLFIAPLGSRKRREPLFGEIVSLHPQNNFSSLLFIGPNSFFLSEIRRQFFSYLKKDRGASAYIPFPSLTIKQVASMVRDADRKGSTVLTERARTLIICDLLKDGNIGQARILSDLYRKTGHYILDRSLEQVKEDIRALVFEEKARDRAVSAVEVLQRYERELRDRDLSDPVEVLRESIRNIGLGESDGLFHTLVIDGFFDPTPLETAMLKALIERAENAYVLAEEGTDMLEMLRSHQPGMKAVYLKRTVVREKTGCYTYPSMEAEVEGIAAHVKKLILEGMKPGEITVSFPVLSKYLPMVRRIFRKHGLPMSAGEYELSAAKPLIALSELLTCITEDYPRNAFLSVLASRYFPLVPDIVRERAVSYAYRAGIIKGRQSWLSIKNVLRDRNDEKGAEAEKKRLDNFQKGINRMIASVEAIKQKRAIVPFLDELEAILDKWGFFDALSSGGMDGTAGNAADMLTDRFSELRRLAVTYPGGLSTAGGPEWYLRYMLQDMKGFDEGRDGVRIIPYELAAGMETEAFFFGGVIEGDFPSRPGIDPILPEKVKRSLGIPDLEYYLDREKHYFRRLIHMSRHDPHISLPEADGDKMFLPSPFIDWERMLPSGKLNMFTEEDVQIGEGSAHHLDSRSRAETYFDHDSSDILHGFVRRMARRYFRVTDLDYYRKCPFRFYIDRVLGLEIEKPPRFEVEYRQWGTLAHRTMEHLFSERDWNMNQFEERLFRALEKSLREIPVPDFWAHVTREIFRNLLPMMKKQEAEFRARGFIPWLIEEKIDADIDGIKLRGKIDRVDRHAGASPSDSVILLDYKTGDIDKKSLQLPLYARMWQETHEQQVDEAGYYSLKEGTVTSYPTKKKSIDVFIQEALEETAALIRQMTNGMFPAEPAYNACRSCPHGALCGNG